MFRTQESLGVEENPAVPRGEYSSKADSTSLKRVFREAEAAAYIGMSRSFLKQGRYTGPVDGQIPPPPYLLMGKRTVRYLKEDLDAWIARFPRLLSNHMGAVGREE